MDFSWFIKNGFLMVYKRQKMKFWMALLMCLLGVGCKFKLSDVPGSEMTYNGVYLTNQKSPSDKEIKDIFTKSCDGINCRVINNRFFYG